MQYTFDIRHNDIQGMDNVVADTLSWFSANALHTECPMTDF